MSDPLCYALDPTRYMAAMRSAEEKDGSINYHTLQLGDWALAYNPLTRDAYFIKRFELGLILPGYAEAWPMTGELPLESRRAIIEDLAANGWPDMDGV